MKGFAVFAGATALVLGLAVVSSVPARAQVGHASLAQAEGGAYLGVTLQDLNDDLRESYGYRGEGVVVTRVDQGGPAARAGLREGDVIVRFHDHGVRSASDLAAQVRHEDAGDRVTIDVWREGQMRTFHGVELGTRQEVR